MSRLPQSPLRVRVMPPKLHTMPRYKSRAITSRSCFPGKSSHPHVRYTEGTAKSLAEQRTVMSGSPWSHFRCHKCGDWHVGHTPEMGVMVERKVVFA